MARRRSSGRSRQAFRPWAGDRLEEARLLNGGWAADIGSIGEAGGWNGLAFDQSGTTAYVAGGSNDSTTGSVFFAKYDTAGHQLGATTFPLSGAGVGCTMQQLVQDSSGNFYAVGNFSGTAALDMATGPGSLASSGGSDAFVLKLNPDGKVLWGQSIGGPGSDYASSLAVDGGGNMYVTGMYLSSDLLLGDGTPLLHKTSTGYAGYVVKLSSGGAKLWAQQIQNTGDSNYPTVNSVVAAPSGLYVAGTFSGQTTFGTHPTPASADPMTSGAMGSLPRWTPPRAISAGG